MRASLFSFVNSQSREEKIEEEMRSTDSGAGTISKTEEQRAFRKTYRINTVVVRQKRREGSEEEMAT